MKKIVIIPMIFLLIVALTACSNKTDSDLSHFESKLDEVNNKQDKLEKVMDEINLKELDHLSKTDTTDKNRKEFIQLQDDINKQLIPAFKEYEKSAKQLPDETHDVKVLKAKYLKTVKTKKKSIYDVKKFVDLCNDSIKDNEDILDYTKLFEKNRSQVEKKIKNASNQEDANQLTSKLESNNKDLKETAQKHLDTSSSNAKSAKKAIKNYISPLIEKQIKDINQTNISDKNVNDARKNAIEMYYSLQNYYDTRIDTIEVGEKISKINVDKLPKEGKDIDRKDKAFNSELKKVKQKND
ncbi:lipoprotein [Staphylococcus warneri]|uniref:EMYY motif lipoprotein n=1 Tax=Staphylococcus warneri TaxID=1292 RepID=UPI000F6F5E12|nr:EMYY motif lipoprotein [Staphylococcus warneri]VED33008.1 lipoprotein [Staphylococcus warneri]